jgi:hypothetical protein
MDNILNKRFWGLVTYEKVNKCLMGLWSNSDQANSGIIMNEIARKSNNDECLDGEYVVSWIESDMVILNGTLSIVNESNIYLFEWRVNNLLFRGRGLRLGDNKLVALYWKPEEFIED